MTLVSGTTSSDLVLLQFAYTELRHVATDTSPSSSTRRTALFSDQKYNPSLWSTLARASLLRLGEDYQILLRRGAPAPSGPSTAIASTPAASTLPSPPTTPILRKPIYKAPRQSSLSRVLNAFASDSELAKPTEAVAKEVESAARDAHVPELFRSVAATAPSMVPAPPPTAPAPASSAVPQARALIKRVVRVCGDNVVPHVSPQIRLLGAELYEWATRDRIHKRAEKVLPHRELDALVVECEFSCFDGWGVPSDARFLTSTFGARLCVAHGRQIWYRSAGYSAYT